MGARADRLTDLDRFVVRRLRERGLELAPRADRRTLVRRLYLDVLGLPPSFEDIEAFAADRQPAAWERLVDRVLASPRYGERAAQHWLDVVRYGDTHGFEVNTSRENAWPYRDWVIDALNRDQPYDRFVFEQIAGDTVGAPQATGFLVAAAALLPGQIGADDESKRLARQDELDEIIQGTTATFLGLTVSCARCHDHKFDPITSRDYYAMQAFFAGIEYGDRPLTDRAQRERMARAASLAPRIEALRAELARFEPRAFSTRTVVADELDTDRAQHLAKSNGQGTNPDGAGRGEKNDVGDAHRVSNLSGGRYTWWDNAPGRDVLAYRPGVEGRFRTWISWGVHGSGVHTRDARYVFDRDGDLATRGDQSELARVDQYYPAGVHEGETPKRPLWSGFLDIGVLEWGESSRLIVRGGETGTGITADVIVLQEPGEFAEAGSGSSLPKRTPPRFRRPVNARGNVERFPATRAKFLRFTTLATVDDNRHEPCIDELEVFTALPADAVARGESTRNVAAASAGAVASSSGNYDDPVRHRLEHIHDGRYGNAQSWISNQRGGGWVQIEFAEPTDVDRVEWARDRTGKFPDRLPVRYRIDVSLDGTSWRRVAGHDDRVPFDAPYDRVAALRRRVDPESFGALERRIEELDRLRDRKRELERARVVFAGISREPDETFVLRRGDPEQRLESIGPRVPQFLGGDDSVRRAAVASPKDEGRRVALARWIASPENPLTARVMVNRIWQIHFGRGIVDTPSDFGVSGIPPTHPDLLDWLAGEFVRSGWSMKALHRRILVSATYRQSSRHDETASSVDRDNRYWWRFPSRRIEAEAIRDGMLVASGELQLDMGGPGFDFFRSRGGLNGFPPVTEFGPDKLRRMIYAHKIRMESVPVFGAFDCPDAGQATPVRSRSTTAIQALGLFNSPFVIARAERLAGRVQREVESPGSSDVSARSVERAFEIALGRRPSAVELRASLRTVDEHGLATLCRVLLNCSEFLVLP